MCLQIVYLIYMQKQDMALNNQQGYAIKPNRDDVLGMTLN